MTLSFRIFISFFSPGLIRASTTLNFSFSSSTLAGARFFSSAGAAFTFSGFAFSWAITALVVKANIKAATRTPIKRCVKVFITEPPFVLCFATYFRACKATPNPLTAIGGQMSSLIFEPVSSNITRRYLSACGHAQADRIPSGLRTSRNPRRASSVGGPGDQRELCFESYGRFLHVNRGDTPPDDRWRFLSPPARSSRTVAWRRDSGDGSGNPRAG